MPLCAVFWISLIVCGISPESPQRAEPPAVPEKAEAAKAPTTAEDAGAAPLKPAAVDAALAPAPASTPTAVLPLRYPLMRELQGTFYGSLLDGNRMAVSGWLQGSYTASSDKHENTPMGQNFRANQFLFQQSLLRIERTVAPSGGTDPSFGFRLDQFYGTDYRYTQARGLLFSQQDNGHGVPYFYGYDPVQFYLEGFFPTVGRGLDVKVGRFYSIYGNEAVEAPANSLSSHSYSFVYCPFTHTGVLATLKLTDAVTVQAAVVAGEDVFLGPWAEPYFTGGIKWNNSDLRDTILAVVIIGPGRFNQSREQNNFNMIDVVYTHLCTRRLTYILEGMAAYQTNVPHLGDVRWYGVVNNFTQQFTARLSGTFRLEFWDDDQGQRTSFPGLYTDATYGFSYKPNNFLTLRQEIRYDYNGRSRPFENKHDLVTSTFDFIVRW